MHAGLSDDQHDTEALRIRAAHRELVAQQKLLEDWVARLKHVVEAFDLRTARPRGELRQVDEALGTIDAKLA